MSIPVCATRWIDAQRVQEFIDAAATRVYEALINHTSTAVAPAALGTASPVAAIYPGSVLLLRARAGNTHSHDPILLAAMEYGSAVPFAAHASEIRSIDTTPVVSTSNWIEAVNQVEAVLNHAGLKSEAEFTEWAGMATTAICCLEALARRVADAAPEGVPAPDFDSSMNHLQQHMNTTGPTPQPSEAQRHLKAKQGRGKDINGRMLSVMSQDTRVIVWSASQWAKHLRCSAGTVKGTKAWKSLLTLRQSEARTAAQMMDATRLTGSRRS